MAEGTSRPAVRRTVSARVDVRRILWATGALVIVICAACVGVYALLSELGQGTVRGWVSPSVDRARMPPAPRLESTPAASLQAYLREQRSRLESYRWVDRDRGVVQIPIERAMQLVAEGRAAARQSEKAEARDVDRPLETASAAARRVGRPQITRISAQQVGPPPQAARVSAQQVGPLHIARISAQQVGPPPQATRVSAQQVGPPHVTRLSTQPVGPHNLARDVGFDQRLGAPLPLHARFRDETGADVELGQYVGSRPLVLVMTYYECPNLCTLVLNGLVSGLRQVTFDAGKQFDVLAVSISPRDTPALARGKRATYVASYGRGNTQAGWHFLTGQPSQITLLARSIGFRYFYDERSQQYAHAAGIVLIAPDGRITRYLPGVAFPAQELRLGLVEASANRIGTLTDRLWLLCYHYDAATGRYSLLVERILRMAGALVALALAALIGLLLWRERARAGTREPR